MKKKKKRGGGRGERSEQQFFNPDLLLLLVLQTHFPPPSRHQLNAPNETSSRRNWKPNVQHKSLWLSAAGKHVRLPVTTTALRSIDKSGGLDAFLLNTKPEKLDPAASRAELEDKQYMDALLEDFLSQGADLRGS